MKKYSLAYGRNLDIKRMKERCPHCKLVGKGMLKDWQLAFKKYITIEKKLGKEVPVGIWEIDEIAEKELDIIEDFPTMYRKEYVEIEINGKLEQALVYIINDTNSKFPDKPYFERILIGYNDFKFDRKYLDEAVARIPKKKVFIVSNEKPSDYIKGCQTVGLKADYGLKCENIEEYDGLILCGGGDVNPKMYNQKNISSKNINDEMDEIVFNTIKDFSEKNKAILGICLGCQYLNVFFGGSLKQDIKNHKDIYHYNVTDNLIMINYLGKEFKVNSTHHQCIDKLGNGLQVCAVSEDGIIEAFMDKNKKILGIQWHPELLLNTNGVSVFEMFKTML